MVLKRNLIKLKCNYHLVKISHKGKYMHGILKKRNFN